jgi:hypothetical protein
MCSPCRSRRVATPTPPALWTEAGLPKLSGLLVGDDQAPLQNDLVFPIILFLFCFFLFLLFFIFITL